MRNRINNRLVSPPSIFFYCIVTFAFLPLRASSETYQFERLWPTLPQPWYFNGPAGIAADKDGSIYVVDSSNSRILKFTQDGYFITMWGIEGSTEGAFTLPYGIAIDSEGNVYVSVSEQTSTHEEGNHRIEKFSSSGRLLAMWGGYGHGKNQFDSPSDIAVNESGDVYVVDAFNHRIQKFTSDGKYLLEWGEGRPGTGDTQFDTPSGIAIDHNGNVYVADTHNSRIKKFDPDGNFVPSNFGEEFHRPTDIAIDNDDNVYVVDSDNWLIRKFTSNGDPLGEWGSSGTGDGQFKMPSGITVDSNRNVYVTDTGYHCIQKFTSNGSFINKWASSGSGNGQFMSPYGVAVDTNGDVYVADQSNLRIQKFDSTGKFLRQWDRWKMPDGSERKFGSLWGIATDSNNNVFVVDPASDACCVYKFDADGNYMLSWGGYGIGNGKFTLPSAVAVDHNSGDVYVADCGYYTTRIQKFKPEQDNSGKIINYEYETHWGSFGSVVGAFINPSGIALDDSDPLNVFVYVADTDNNRIQKFDSTGNHIKSWGKVVDGKPRSGEGEGEFGLPWGIAVDDSDPLNVFVYVTEAYNMRIQKLDSDGNYCTSWGALGTDPDQMREPHGIAIGTNNNIYVSDHGNNRIQVFKRINIAPNSRAIIVAGGGAYAGNNLWDATQASANFAYRALTYQGFTKQTIYYLTADLDLDIDHNGVFDADGVSDDVDGEPTRDNLAHAITTWAQNADSLVVYLTDHGGDKTFRLNQNRTLSAATLASWLDQVQQTITETTTVIYEACESGSFLAELAGPERIVITSTSPQEQAKFLSQGTISFSSFFFTQVFNGQSLAQAFVKAWQAVTFTFDNQNPLLDDTGDGAFDGQDGFLANSIHLGSGVGMLGEAPVIGSVSVRTHGSNAATFYADEVTDPDGIARVWAIIWPPGYLQASVANPADSPVLAFPSVSLMPVACDDPGAAGSCYEGSYDGFSMAETLGTYQVAVYAMDGQGNVSVPALTTVSFASPLTRKAIIVAGESYEHWPAIESSAGQAYHALCFQGYSDTDIKFMSPVTFSGGVDYAPSLFNLTNDLTVWAAEGTLALVVYLIGSGSREAFSINSSETLTAGALDSLLDDLQSKTGVRVTVVYDADRAGSFIPVLCPPENKERMVVCSTGENEAAYFSPAGDMSFSQFFWNQALNGATVYHAFSYAKQAVAFLHRANNSPFSCYRQTPMLDDNGNGVANERSEGQLARNHRIGMGVLYADDAPVIGSAGVDDPNLTGGQTATTIWAEDISTTGTIKKVWAVIIPPAYCPAEADDRTAAAEVELTDDDNDGRYQYQDYDGFYTTVSGAYKISVYAMDADGNISSPVQASVYQSVGPDIYEEDDTYLQANVIIVNYAIAQSHNFDDYGDSDWVMFYGMPGKTYTIEAGNLGSRCEPVIELYQADGVTLLGAAYDSIEIMEDDVVVERKVLLEWSCNEEGSYYVQVWHYPGAFGENTEYELTVYNPELPLLGLITGTIASTDGDFVEDATITTDGGFSALSVNGEYAMVHQAGIYTMSARAAGYLPFESTVTVEEGGIAIKNITLVPESGNNADGGGGSGNADLHCTSDLECDAWEVCNQQNGQCVECISDAHCDDGLFCNGAETCSFEHRCMDGTSPCGQGQACNEEKDNCAALPAPCLRDEDCAAGLVCDPETGTCRAAACTDDSACDDGFFCNGLEECEAGVCVAREPPCTQGQLCMEAPAECWDVVVLEARTRRSSIRPPVIRKQRCLWLKLQCSENPYFIDQHSTITLACATGAGQGVTVHEQRDAFQMGTAIMIPVCIAKEATAGEWTIRITTGVAVVEASFAVK